MTPPTLPDDLTLTPVQSSTVKAVGYHPGDRVLVVLFHSSDEPYCYRDVPDGVWRWLAAAPSKGKFLHAYVKGKFPFTRTYPVLRCEVHEAITVEESANG